MIERQNIDQDERQSQPLQAPVLNQKNSWQEEFQRQSDNNKNQKISQQQRKQSDVQHFSNNFESKDINYFESPEGRPSQHPDFKDALQLRQKQLENNLKQKQITNNDSNEQKFKERQNRQSMKQFEKRDLNFNTKFNDDLQQSDSEEIMNNSDVQQNQTQQNEIQQDIVCEECEQIKGLNLKRYILAQTDNQIFRMDSFRNLRVLIFPSCACEEKLTLEQLITLFGEDKVTKQIFKANININKDFGICQYCNAQNTERVKPLECQEDHLLCSQCYELHICKSCTKVNENKKKSRKLDQSEVLDFTKLQSNQSSQQLSPDNLTLNKQNLDKLNHKRKKSIFENRRNLFKQSTQSLSQQSSLNVQLNDDQEVKQCECRINKDFLAANFGSIGLDELDVNYTYKCELCSYTIAQQVLVSIQQNFNMNSSNQQKHLTTQVKSKTQAKQNQIQKSQEKQKVQIESPRELKFVNQKCVICNQQKLSKRLCQGRCNHYICKYCITQSLLNPLSQELLNRKKIKSDMIQCPESECQKLIHKDILIQLVEQLMPQNLQEAILEKLELLFEPSNCSENEDEDLQIKHQSFLDQQKWLQICIDCNQQQCIVCETSLQECICKRCTICDSANLVKRSETKSYFCPGCNKHFCEDCNQTINQCECLQSRSSTFVNLNYQTQQPQRQQNAQNNQYRTQNHNQLSSRQSNPKIDKRQQLQYEKDKLNQTINYDNTQQVSGISGFLSGMLDKAFGSHNKGNANGANSYSSQ